MYFNYLYFNYFTTLVLLYVSNDIKCVAIDKLNHLKCESLWVELQEHTGASLTLGVCYRSQSAAYSEIRDMFTLGKQVKGDV